MQHFFISYAHQIVIENTISLYKVNSRKYGCLQYTKGCIEQPLKTISKDRRRNTKDRDKRKNANVIIVNKIQCQNRRQEVIETNY